MNGKGKRRKVHPNRAVECGCLSRHHNVIALNGSADTVKKPMIRRDARARPVDLCVAHVAVHMEQVF